MGHFNTFLDNFGLFKQNKTISRHRYFITNQVFMFVMLM